MERSSSARRWQRAEEVEPGALRPGGRPGPGAAPVARPRARPARSRSSAWPSGWPGSKTSSSRLGSSPTRRIPSLSRWPRPTWPGCPPRSTPLTDELQALLVPRDPHDDRDAIMEIRAGTGGDEAALFAADLYRMYQRYSERHGLRWEPISLSDGTLGGIKEAIVAVRGPEAFGLLRRESGVHRVQRVPATETQGRIHTSAATVAVLPEAEEVDVKIEPQDLKIDVFRSSGPGGQSVNTTDSAVRITHLPTGARGEPAGPEVAASEQDQGDGGAAGPAARPDDRRAGGGARAGPPGDGRHRRPLGQDPDLQLSPEPGDRPPDQPLGAQPGRRARRPSRRVVEALRMASRQEQDGV